MRDLLHDLLVRQLGEQRVIVGMLNDRHTFAARVAHRHSPSFHGIAVGRDADTNVQPRGLVHELLELALVARGIVEGQEDLAPYCQPPLLANTLSRLSEAA